MIAGNTRDFSHGMKGNDFCFLNYYTLFSIEFVEQIMHIL